MCVTHCINKEERRSKICWTSLSLVTLSPRFNSPHQILGFYPFRQQFRALYQCTDLVPLAGWIIYLSVFAWERKMKCDEVLKAVFPYLEGEDLASCMGVCKQWRNLAQDDFFWKCVCAKRWPSICKKPSPPTVTYYKLYQTFYKRKQHRTLLPPRLSFDDLEFFIDIWTEDGFIFSEMVPGPILQSGIKIPPPGACDMLKFHLEGPEYRMKLPVDPRFTVPLSQTVSVSVLVGRKDSNRVACIINRSMFDYIDRTAYRAMANDYLDFSPVYPFVSGIRAWISLLFMEEGNDGAIDVFGIEMDFCDAANSKEEVLWLLDMLDWK